MENLQQYYFRSKHRQHEIDILEEMRTKGMEERIREIEIGELMQILTRAKTMQIATHTANTYMAFLKEIMQLLKEEREEKGKNTTNYMLVLVEYKGGEWGVTSFKNN
jgi:tRNA(Phe) wybutosine-synthesizing methylase Tyw3